MHEMQYRDCRSLEPAVITDNLSHRFALMFSAGLACAAMQTMFLREYLSVFSGNEFVIGVIWAFWLIATAAGSKVGGRLTKWNNIFPLLFIFSVIIAIIIIRAVRLLFEPGEVIAPWHIIIIVFLTQTDTAFFGGLVFGWLSRAEKGPKLYLAENGGSVLGLVILSICILSNISNGYMITSVLLLFSVSVFYKSKFLFPALIVLAVFLMIDSVSIHWKYPGKIDLIQNGAQGEVAITESDGGTTTFLDGTIYRSDISRPSIEQAVHLPAAMLEKKIQRVVVIGNQGQIAQLKKYPDLHVDCLETEPLLAVDGCKCAAVEALRSIEPYDLVLIGSGLPSSGATCRFFTLEFFKRMRILTGANGVLSFTLQLSENYLSPQEKKLKDLLQTTLLNVFRHVFVIPGDGYTFIASDNRLLWPVKPLVPTSYLEAYTLASLTDERIDQANSRLDTMHINTIEKPKALLLAQKQWLDIFGIRFLIFYAISAVLIVIAFVFLPRTKAAQSIATSGFATGVYSVTLLLIYQFTYGTLYSNISLLMIALTAGFVIGSCIKKFPFSDLVIGIYTAGTLVLLITIPFPPLVLFFIFHGGIGILSGAQFVTRKNTSWSGLYAADLTGGVLGMTLCSTLMVPYFGITAVAAGLGVIKLISAFISMSASGSSLQLTDSNRNL